MAFAHTPRCALPCCASKNTKSVLPAQRSNAQLSVCVNATTEIHRVTISRIATYRTAQRGVGPMRERPITRRVLVLYSGQLVASQFSSVRFGGCEPALTLRFDDVGIKGLIWCPTHTALRVTPVYVSLSSFFLIFRPHHTHAMQPFPTYVARIVTCVSVCLPCWARWRVVQKRMKRSRCCSGIRLVCPNEPCIR